MATKLSSPISAGAPPSPCGNDRCLNGWIWWSGSEYPCDACRRIFEARRLKEESPGETK